MRLLHTESETLHEFIGDNTPRYAILSHTWEQGEVSFADWQSGDHTAQQKAGLYKILGACQQARKDGLQWIWVDTVCIDKNSSAELSEAINSMYQWYQNAAICYAYLQDVEISNPEHFKCSRWWSRGWTLQELLAPYDVWFFDKTWSRIGSKLRSLTNDVCEASGIAPQYICNASPIPTPGGSVMTQISWKSQDTPARLEDGYSAIRSASVATRMSWASRRTTTRPEDMAYCLLGLFGLNMPLLYGEGGTKAFLRLQKELIQASVDHTLFCWHWNSDVPKHWISMLAPSITTFADTGGYQTCENEDDLEYRSYAFTNLGLSIELPVFFHGSLHFVLLNVRNETGHVVAIPLKVRWPRHTKDAVRLSFPPIPLALSKSYSFFYLEDRTPFVRLNIGQERAMQPEASSIMSTNPEWPFSAHLHSGTASSRQYYILPIWVLPSGFREFGNKKHIHILGRNQHRHLGPSPLFCLDRFCILGQEIRATWLHVYLEPEDCVSSGRLVALFVGVRERKDGQHVDAWTWDLQILDYPAKWSDFCFEFEEDTLCDLPDRPAGHEEERWSKFLQKVAQFVTVESDDSSSYTRPQSTRDHKVLSGLGKIVESICSDEATHIYRPVLLTIHPTIFD